MPPALTRAAATGVDAYALFRAIDIDDSSAVPGEELLLCGAALGAHWADWAPAAVDELLGRGSFYAGMPLSLTEFGAFCDAVKISDLDQKRVAEFVAAGNARRAAADPFDAARIARAFKAIDLDDSGQIDLDELLAFGQAVGQEWTRAACQSLLGKMDKDGDQLVSFTEFDGFLREVGLHGDKGAVAAFLEAGEERRRRVGAADEEDETGASQEV